MATKRDSIEVRMRLARAKEFQREANKSARSVDNIGDQAAQAARKLLGLNAATSRTRINLGPFSTGMRLATFALGATLLGTESLIKGTLSLGEAVGTAGAGAAAAGGVFGTALLQGLFVARAGVTDLTDALGGNEAALKRLPPEAQNLFYTLNKGQQQLKATANRGLFPGLEAGAKSAMKNLPVANRIIGDTAKTLGGLARDGGNLVGSKSWGKDLADIGKTNTRILDNMGHAGLNFADAAKDIIHEAGPLATWLSKMALGGSRLTQEWVRNARETGKLSRFFKEAKTDLRLLGSITGNLAGGVINLFGHQDVDGTKTLRNLDRLTQRFQDWTTQVEGKKLGPELQRQFQLALGGIATFVGENFARAGTTALDAFAKAFLAADLSGKLAIGAFIAFKSGLLKAILSKSVSAAFTGASSKGGVLGSLAQRGSPKNPLYVIVVNGGAPGVAGEKGGGKGSLLKRLAPLGVAGAKIGGVVGLGALVNDALGDPTGTHKAGNRLAKGKSPWASVSDFLFGAPRSQSLSKVKPVHIPSISLNSMGGTPHNQSFGLAGMIALDNHVVVQLHDKPIYESTNRSVIKQTARRNVRKR